jgi:steroid 5-alpha reductase family enzyme
MEKIDIMASIINIAIINFNLVCVMMLLGWLFSLLKRNVNIVDSLWGLGFVLIAWSTFLYGDGYYNRKSLILILTSLWGIRLSVYLTWRNWGKAEDKRYDLWRKEAGASFWIVSLFKIFILQAVFMSVIAVTIQWPQLVEQPDFLTPWDWLGSFICLIGIGIETIADTQLALFKNNPANRGKILRHGLWAYSRHPNYFGECLVWWGFYLICLSNPSGLWTVLSPIIITLVLLKMTGVALTEKTMLSTRPEYRDYIKRTQSFIPWFPKKES